MKKSSERNGKTFLEKKQIMTILGLSKGESEPRWMTTSEIVEIANIMGWTTPMKDPNRKAASHPYSKILSMMTDVLNDTYYINAVVSRKGNRKGKKTEFCLI